MFRVESKIALFVVVVVVVVYLSRSLVSFIHVIAHFVLGTIVTTLQGDCKQLFGR